MLEFVYFCVKSMEGFHKLKPHEKKGFHVQQINNRPRAFAQNYFFKKSGKADRCPRKL